MNSRDERIGHALNADEYPLTVDELAAVAAMTAHRPRNPPNDEAQQLTDRLWADLTLIDSDLARKTWALALTDGAHGAQLTHIADDLLTKHTDDEKETL